MKSKVQQKDIFMLLGIIGVIIFSIWKAHYGLGGKDVSFYLNIPYRMIHGDVLFWDEWNLAQLSSFLLYPIMKIYMLIVGTTESMMLHFRYIYIIINSIIALIIYSRIRKFGNISVIVVIIYALFSPFNHTMLSYNSMGMMFGFLGVVLLATSNKNITFFLSGGCYAIATLCQPLLALVFIIASVIILVYCFAKKKKTVIYQWLIFTSACLLLAMPVFVYFVINVGIERLLLCLPGMTMDLSAEHSVDLNLISSMKNILGALLPKTVYNLGRFTVNTVYIMALMYVIIFVIWGLYIFNRLKNKVREAVYIKALCIVCALSSFVCCLTIKTNPINIVCFPWIFPGIMAYLHLKNKDLKKLYFYSGIWGVIHMVSYLTSNGGAAVFTVALFPMTALSFIVIYTVYKENARDHKKISVTNICIGITLLSLIFVRGVALFRDDSVVDLNKKIESGPAKGLYVNGYDYALYHNIQTDVERLDYKSKNLLLLTERTWTYLFIDAPLAQYSTYLPGINKQTMNVLKTYYHVNKSKSPEVIYIPRETLESITLEDVVISLELNVDKTEKLKNGHVLYCK